MCEDQRQFTYYYEYMMRGRHMSGVIMKLGSEANTGHGRLPMLFIA